MKAKITTGELAGTEFELSDKTIEGIRKAKKEVRVDNFLAKISPTNSSCYVLALNDPDRGSKVRIYNLPDMHKGRGAFSKTDIRKIIKGLQDLIGG